jgi:hypothetical protein
MAPLRTTEPDKTREGKSKQDKTRQGETKGHGKTRQKQDQEQDKT